MDKLELGGVNDVKPLHGSVVDHDSGHKFTASHEAILTDLGPTDSRLSKNSECLPQDNADAKTRCLPSIMSHGSSLDDNVSMHVTALYHDGQVRTLSIKSQHMPPEI
ncbi:hypothetical protein AMTR_s00050p00192490 [Amborella trichopoda]|uniref:Uncharacterized protein n=1 Tax=Amborella trichopoda TaxID=13333 RepID=W1PXZ8_AMBTC|nr:hypothetical protein AMTR_s00050p00192490 [Amborella trichopoda]